MVQQHLCQRMYLLTGIFSFLTVGLRPYYLPREFPQLFVTTVYIPTRADVNNAAATISRTVQNLERQSPDAVQLIMGDFNGCSLDAVMPPTISM